MWRTLNGSYSNSSGMMSYLYYYFNFVKLKLYLGQDMRK